MYKYNSWTSEKVEKFTIFNETHLKVFKKSCKQKSLLLLLAKFVVGVKIVKWGIIFFYPF